MAASSFRTNQYTSSQFVESAGAILFSLTTRKVCLVRLITRDEWLLAKGRRACGESRLSAALREATEETGYKCRPLLVTMQTRATPKIETDRTSDMPQTYQDMSEPFNLTIRTLGEQDVKLIWWYIATIDDAAPIGKGEDAFEVGLFTFDEAIPKLKYVGDREILQQAIDIVTSTYKLEVKAIGRKD
ncbi:hypothetical protein B0O99DRAFT_680522 [Bisporella sp. PMI_857]|nr:hypothetical protein B0O99DRAFT_680522 [Bisporella sp. PMI_857]